MGYTYRNSNTGDVYYFDNKNPELDALPNWDVQEGAEVPESAKNAAEAAAAQVASIEAAATNRLDRTKGAAEGMANTSEVRNTTTEAAVPVPTLADAQPRGEADQSGLLSSDKMRGGAVQIGPNPEIHPVGRAELEAKQAEDIANPPKTGVLGRAKADQRAGRTQIGPDPEVHVGDRAKAAGQKADTAGEPSGNASEEEWRTWVIATGKAKEDEVSGLGRNELREKYGTKK